MTIGFQSGSTEYTPPAINHLLLQSSPPPLLWGKSNWYKVILSLRSWFSFSGNTNDFEHLFTWLLAIRDTSSVKVLYKSFAHFSIKLFELSLFICKGFHVLYPFRILILYGFMHCKYSLPVCDLPLYFLYKVSCNKRKFDEVKSCVFSFRVLFVALLQWIFISIQFGWGIGSPRETRKQRRETQRPFGSSLTFIKGLKSAFVFIIRKWGAYSHKDPLSGMKGDPAARGESTVFLCAWGHKKF